MTIATAIVLPTTEYPLWLYQRRVAATLGGSCRRYRAQRWGVIGRPFAGKRSRPPSGTQSGPPKVRSGWAGKGSCSRSKDYAQATSCAATGPRLPGWTSRLLAVNEQAERVTGRVEHHSQAIAVSIRWLPCRLIATELQRLGDGVAEVVDFDLEVHHLRQAPRLFGPSRRLVFRVTLDVQMYTPRRIEQLGPTSARAEVSHLEADEPLVEARHRSRPLAVQAQRYPSEPHPQSVAH